MQIYKSSAVNDQHTVDSVFESTHISDAIALLLELDQLLWWNDRHIVVTLLSQSTRWM